MNLAMQQPVSYPFYMDSPRLRFPLPWPSNHFQYSVAAPQYYSSLYQASPTIGPISYHPLPFILSHQPRRNPPPMKATQAISSYSNMRYNHLKQSTNHTNRHRSMDVSFQSQRHSMPNAQYQPSKAKSISDFHQIYRLDATNLPKAHSWHSINHLQQSNMNKTRSTKAPSVSNHRQQHAPSPKSKVKIHKGSFPSSLSPKQQTKFEQGVVRISTLDEIPIIKNPIYNKNATTPSQNEVQIPIPANSAQQPTSSSSSPSTRSSSNSSLQKMLNGSLSQDPLLSAAIEDFRQHRQISSRSVSLTPHNRDLSRDSLCSDTTHRSSSASSTSLSSSTTPSSSHAANHDRSQSSFTSLERLEIRRLIKALKTNGLPSLNIPLRRTSNSQSSTPKGINKKKSTSLLQKDQQEKSSVTEELERAFNKLRLDDPNHELIYVKPSSIAKQNKSNLPLLNTDKNLSDAKQTDHNDISQSKHYNNNETSISTEILKCEKDASKTKPEYSILSKDVNDVNLRSIKKDEQIRSFSFCKPISDIDKDIQHTRPVSMFNWLHSGLTNQLPTTFQPKKPMNNHKKNNNFDKSLVKENIYASDIDVHIPLSEEQDFLKSQTIASDDLSNGKHTTSNSSILSDFSRLFARSGNNKHEQKIKLKRKLKKNNNLRCSIM